MTQHDLEIPADIEQWLSEALCSGGVSEADVAEAERKLGLSFPREYRTFLLEFGAALMQGYQVYGLVRSAIADDDNLWIDVRTQMKLRKEYGFPNTLIPISTDGTECNFFITTTPLPGAVVNSVVVASPDRENVQVATGFFDFLRRAQATGVYDLVGA